MKNLFLRFSATFTLTVSPASQLVGLQGGSVNYSVTITGGNGFTNSVSLSVSGLSAGATAGFTPPSVSGSGGSTLSVTASNGTPQGVYTLTIMGVGGGYTNMATATLAVLAPLFTGVALAGTNLVFSGIGGYPGSNYGYYVLAGTNLAVPPVNWTVVATGAFDQNGSFVFTNGWEPNSGQQFYLLQLQ
ncbi:MAG: hypothetical protein KGJ60_08445 [Verrucomicrobiota bacterium]|nr:hypothetical protein [Verrucomicrobiota bacterium]